MLCGEFNLTIKKFGAARNSRLKIRCIIETTGEVLR
jgi:hypothetical protein